MTTAISMLASSDGNFDAGEDSSHGDESSDDDDSLNGDECLEELCAQLRANDPETNQVDLDDIRPGKVSYDSACEMIGAAVQGNTEVMRLLLRLDPD